MDQQTIATILISTLTSAATTLIVLVFKVGRYIEKTDQLERYDLSQRLSKLEGKFETSNDLRNFVQKRSPLSLTDKGRLLLEKSGGLNYINNNKSLLINEIKLRKPKSAYDVQELAKDVITDHTAGDKFIPLKNYLYQNGLDLAIIVNVMGIYLRDITLDALNFKQEDIDNYAPNTDALL